MGIKGPRTVKVIESPVMSLHIMKILCICLLLTVGRLSHCQDRDEHDRNDLIFANFKIIKNNLKVLLDKFNGNASLICYQLCFTGLCEVFYIFFKLSHRLYNPSFTI